MLFDCYGRRIGIRSSAVIGFIKSGKSLHEKHKVQIKEIRSVVVLIDIIVT
ncbi:hypothetical protein [Clostridium sp. AWRP]|uniref:hypothetical protein n=1 Tax=Clostridium sp. AWRP TaxID=2212991 RepID=UPI0015868702|nr:hypothetical protein [Clostridium sp. AWRP]